MKFSELGMQPEIMDALGQLGFEDCTAIQETSMPHILEGKDVAGLAQTGTGKTAAFLLPLIDRILKANAGYGAGEGENPERAFTKWEKNHFILVLVPTRELAEQVFENFNKFKGNTGLKGVSIYGGVAYDKQKQALNNGVEFVIATPGRLIDLYKEHLVDMRQVRAIVFDEADRMFDMGFKDDMKYILQRVPKDRQFLVFSATLNFDVLNTAYQFGAQPIEVNVSRDQAKAENVVDKIFHVGFNERPGYLLAVLRKHKPRQAIVFSNFKMNVARIAKFLTDNGIPAVGISSLLTQAQRNRVMEQFKGENDQNILVATDVAARGLDIKGVDMVINYELPDDAENYVHRIGRTGRANEKGLAFSLVSEKDIEALSRIEDYLKYKLEKDWLEDAELVKDHKPFPSDRDSGEKRSFSSGGGRKGPPRDGGRRFERGGPRSRRPDRPDGRPDRPERSERPDRPVGRPAPRFEKAADGGTEPRREGRPPRHKHGRRDERRQPALQPSANGQRGGRRNEDKRITAERKQRPGGPRPSAPKAPVVPKTSPSVGQRVSNFFKKLFS